jgi:hypothetical protein
MVPVTSGLVPVWLGDDVITGDSLTWLHEQGIWLGITPIIFAHRNA